MDNDMNTAQSGDQAEMPSTEEGTTPEATAEVPATEEGEGTKDAEETTTKEAPATE